MKSPLYDIMAIPTTKYFFLLTILMVSLGGINGQLTISVVDVPDNIDTMLENITVTSAITASTLNQIVDTQRHLERTLDQMANTQTQMANAVTQMVNLMQMQNEHLQIITTTMAHMVGQLDTQNQLISSQAIPSPASPSPAIPSPAIPRDCSDLASRGQYPSGSYTIRPWDDLGNLRVYCDMDTDGGGWTVFQKRFDGSVDFYLGWDAYEDGFGSLDSEYWMGLRQIHRLTRQGNWTLRIDIQDFDDDTAYAEYKVFSVGDAESFYWLSIGEFSGNAGDTSSLRSNQAFTTKDSDNDASRGNCAQAGQGAWWYKSCGFSNLNGLYLGASQNSATGMRWYYWKSSFRVLKRSEMKMRRIQ